VGDCFPGQLEFGSIEHVTVFSENPMIQDERDLPCQNEIKNSARNAIRFQECGYQHVGIQHDLQRFPPAIALRRSVRVLWMIVSISLSDSRSKRFPVALCLILTVADSARPCRRVVKTSSKESSSAKVRTPTGLPLDVMTRSFSSRSRFQTAPGLIRKSRLETNFTETSLWVSLYAYDESTERQQVGQVYLL